MTVTFRVESDQQFPKTTIAMRTRWVTFDCFGTLVDWHTGFTDILGPLVGDHLPEVVAAYHRCERRLEAEEPYRPYREVLVNGLLLAALETGVSLTEAQARTLPESWARLAVFTDVEDMLAGLRVMGCRLAVLTNCDDDLFEHIHRNFRQPFDLIVTAEQVRAYKPSLARFRHFAGTTGVETADWVHIACSCFHDIQPAGELGIRRIWLDRDRTGEDPAAANARVLSAGEVCDAVARLWR